MRVFAPQIKVTLVKAVKRGDIVPGTKAADRYSKLDAIDLTPFLGENGVVQVVKGVREPAGGFNITFRDSLGRDDKKGGAKSVADTVSALVEPMDLIEIRMCRDPLLYKQGEWPPVVMRGLVSEVTRSESVSGDQPARAVTISGQDFGKVLQIIQIYYLNNSQLDSYYLSEWAFFQKYSDASDAKIKTAKDFLDDAVKNIINKYLKQLTALANGESVGAKKIDEWTTDVSIEGAISPWGVQNMNNVSLHQMLCQLLDVGPFNELFVEDTKDGVKLVVRPNPFLDASGSPIQGVKPEEVKLTDKEIISMSLSRSDAGVANYYWVFSSFLAFMGNEDQQLAAQSGDQKNYVLFDYLNCKRDFYGYRKMEVGTALLPTGYSASEATKEPTVENNNTSLTGWLDKRRKVLSDSNKDNVVFEGGTIQCMGDERLKAGRQLVLTRANAQPVTGYITRVQHTFQPLQAFSTTLTVERMTTFIERAKASTAQYRPEIDAGGVK